MKREINKFYNWLSREIKRREKFCEKQSEKWNDSKTGSKYRNDLQIINDLHDAMHYDITLLNR